MPVRKIFRNLRNAEFEVEEATDGVIDRDDLHRTAINGQQWFEEDFEDEAEDEADGEDAIGAAEVKHVSIEEARAQMQGIMRNWVLETAGEEVGLKPS